MPDALFDLTPVHLVDDGATATRCGIPLHNSRKRSPHPYVAAKHAQAHVDGRGITVCPECQP